MTTSLLPLAGAALGGFLGGGGSLGNIGDFSLSNFSTSGAGLGLAAGGALGGLFGSGGGSSSGGFYSGLGAPNVSTPAFGLSGGNLTQTGTIPQMEFARRFPQQLSQIDALKGQVAPNASLARKAALGQLQSKEEEAVGNLREQLARRGLSGASFAQDTEGRVKAEFAQQRAQTEAGVAQQELQMTMQLIDFERQLTAEALNRELAEFGAASGVAVSGAQIAAGLADSQARLAAAESQARASFFGNLAGLGAGLYLFGGQQQRQPSVNVNVGSGGPFNFGSSGISPLSFGY